MPIAITQINGQNATTFMESIGSVFGLLQDSDAQWNSLFPIYSNPKGNSPFVASPSLLNPSLTLTYENGVTETQETVATINPGMDFSNIMTGDDFYDAFCNPELASILAKNSSTAPRKIKPRLAPRAPALLDYPSPIIQNSDEGTTMGFFLEGAGFEDVAVLAISSFEETDPQYLTNFQKTVESFLSHSREAGKQRLVIDLTSNGGGQVLAGFELFAQVCR